ncbi:MAG: 16S rRNA (uracil(1498)-N(3))-methyltransferase [Anaerolineae bacterium]|nr:16S rRNA (uracil(1498)-N(3))-methyltransferase [Anaerolineae bacterium]
MPHRFFIPPNWLTPPTVTLRGPIARQIKTVLRLRPGDNVIVLDNSGTEFLVTLNQVEKNAAAGRIVAQQPAAGEPKIHLTLYQGALKGQKFEWVLQKGTELGVSCFAPIICRRSVVKRVGALTKKYERWQQIIREAAEQSRRGKLPSLVQPLLLAEAIEQARSSSLLVMPWEEAGGPTLKEVLTQTTTNRIAVFIGPEGGFAAEEAEIARQAGGQLVTLGPRILRAETAALAACAAILYELGEWRAP